MQVQVQPHTSVAGHPHVGTIVITYNIPSGVQGAGHPHPGMPYAGTQRVAYLPDNAEGRQVLSLLKVCFERRHTFAVGRSLTTEQDNVITWGTVHHKTNTSGGETSANANSRILCSLFFYDPSHPSPFTNKLLSYLVF